MTAAGTDAIGALRWGLQRYFLVFLGFLLLGGLLVPFAVGRIQPSAEAEALVIAQRLDMELSALPRYGEAVFNNGPVAQAVAARYGDGGNAQEVIPDRVSLEATQDSIVFQVVGRDENPEVAAGIANTAAEAFIEALNTAGVGVGTFALQSPAEPPADVDDGLSTAVVAGVGIAAGLLLGLAAVSLLLVVRRPVITPADAEEATGVSALGVVAVPGTKPGQFAPPHAFGGLLPVCRRLLALSMPTVLLLSRRQEERDRSSVSVALAQVLTRVRDVRYVGAPAAISAVEVGGERPSALAAERVSATQPLQGRRPDLTVVDGSEPVALVHPPDVTVSVLVVPEGISAAGLRTAVVEHLGGSVEPRILLVRRGARWRGRPSSRAAADEPRPMREELAAGQRS
jgi:capsular polysaccharide biosynthesis protein